MILISRLALAVLSVLALAKLLPGYVGQVFPRDYETVLIAYSAGQQRLIFKHYRSGNWSWSDEQGNPLSEDEMRAALPFAHLRELERLGQLPAEVAGWRFDPEAAARHGTRMRLMPRQLDKPDFPLYTLMESMPGAKGLQTPPDMFRMADRIEFIDAASNRIDEAKSQRYSLALAEAGFTHPARLVADNASTQKAYDNGALLVDAEGRVFHLWQVHGTPRVLRTGTVLPPSVLAIRVLQLPSREYHGIVTLPDQVLFLDWANHAPQRLPLDGHKPATESLSVEETPLHWEFSHTGHETGVRQFVLAGRQLEPLLRHTWHEGDADAGKRTLRATVMGFLFPFKLEFQIDERTQHQLYFSTFGARWWVTLAGIAAALCAHILWCRRRHGHLPHGLNLLFVLFTGWFGAITLAVSGPLVHRHPDLPA
ncbi:DUF4857 domain-containing protein [Thauera sp.]|uniref:DUF4857 domain-containing protein n=1 Tax=Thauera sp. TaxID=1905334 RepID=UPI0039E32627